MKPTLQTRIDRIANGSAEGVRKSWATRKGQNESHDYIGEISKRSREFPAGKTASEASYQALIAGQTANESGDADDRTFAHDTHVTAQKSHEQASSAALARGDRAMSDYHRQRAAGHQLKSVGLMDKVSNTWSDAAREASAEARKAGLGDKSAMHIQIAKEDSENAENKSKIAQASGDVDDHYFARGAHKSAAGAHEWVVQKLKQERMNATNSPAMMKNIPQIDEAIKQHSDKADYHRHKSEEHKKLSNGARIADEYVANIGTQEGVLKAWQTRKAGGGSCAHSPECMQSYRRAIAASVVAREAQTPQDQARLNEKAAQAHDAAQAQAHYEGDKASADYHQTMADSHRTKAFIAKRHVSPVTNRGERVVDGYVSNVAPRTKPTTNEAKTDTTATFTPTMFRRNPPPDTGSQATAIGNPSDASQTAADSLANRKPTQAEKRAAAAEAAVANDAGAGGSGDSGAGGSGGGASSSPGAAPAGQVQGPYGRLAAVSSSPMIASYAAGSVGSPYKVEKNKERLKKELQNAAKMNNGWLPMSKHPTKKEVDLARQQLPYPVKGVLKNGARKVVKLGNCVSKGKAVEFVYNERRDFTKDKNGKVVGEWTNPPHVESDDFLQ
jgi:hypothetical protein